MSALGFIGPPNVVEAVEVRVRGTGKRVREALLAAVTAEAKRLVHVVQDDKLSGQVLGQRTRRLRNSIHETVVATPTGAAATVGTDVVYAAFWEYGFSGTEQVREHLRKITQAFGRPITARQVLVRQHARRVDQAPRSFLRTALAEQEPAIRDAIETAVNRALAGVAP